MVHHFTPLKRLLNGTVNWGIYVWYYFSILTGGGPRVVVSTAAFHARVRGSVPGLGGLKETKMFLPHPRVKVNIVGSLRDREVACSASDRQGSNFESCVWRTVSSQSSHHPQEVLLAQFSLYVHKSGLKPDSFHFSILTICYWGSSLVFSYIVGRVTTAWSAMYKTNFANIRGFIWLSKETVRLESTDHSVLLIRLLIPVKVCRTVC